MAESCHTAQALSHPQSEFSPRAEPVLVPSVADVDPAGDGCMAIATRSGFPLAILAPVFRPTGRVEDRAAYPARTLRAAEVVSTRSTAHGDGTRTGEWRSTVNTLLIGPGFAAEAAVQVKLNEATIVSGVVAFALDPVERWVPHPVRVVPLPEELDIGV